MTIKNSWKRVIAGTLAVLVVAGTVPADLGISGLFGGNSTSITALAWDGDPYTSLLNTTTVVNFDGKEWYLIEDNSTAAMVGTVTLLSKECVGASVFASNAHGNNYSGSTVETYVNNWYTNNIDAKAAVNGSGMFLLTTDQANAITVDVRKCPQVSGADSSVWWLCSAGSKSLEAVGVMGSRGRVLDGFSIATPEGVRPALKLDLSKVTFDSETKTFALADSVDKTALNDAITAAETLYNSIKDNNDYTDIANTLKTAIDNAKAVADSDEADQDAVDAAKDAVTTAKQTAETAKKDVDDTTAANAVIEKINALPASTDISTSDKTDIEAARAAYNALTDDQKAKVTPETLKKLEDAEAALAAAEKDAADQAAADAVTSTINDLPAADDVTTADKADIEAARAAYDALTDDQKAKVTPETLKKLEDAETALAAAEKDAADQAAADAVTSTINDLPAADDVTTADKADIEAARAAYNALTADQKAKVTPETLKKLEDAEEALAAAEKDAADQAAADAVTSTINDLPAADDVTTADKADIEAARKAYDDLTDDQKAKVTPETLKKLEDAETALAAAEKEEADKAAAGTVEEKFNNLPDPENVETTDKEIIEAARAAYDELTDDQKAKVSEEALKKLTDDEEALAAAEKEAADQAAADDVTAIIDKLPAAEDVTTDDKAAIEEARKNYDALTEDQKAKVSDETLKKLTDAEAALAAAEKEAADQAAADDVTALIDKLPAAKDVKTTDKAAIEAARKAYDALTDDQKAKVSADTLKKLTDAEAALAEAEKKTSDDSSKSDSSKTDSSSNAGTNNGSTTNPATGAAAGMGAVALAAAALIVAKKKKDE